eukprot:1033304-Pelagomonas_calceolata.AAC.3
MCWEGPSRKSGADSEETLDIGAMTGASPETVGNNERARLHTRCHNEGSPCVVAMASSTITKGKGSAHVEQS